MTESQGVRPAAGPTTHRLLTIALLDIVESGVWALVQIGRLPERDAERVSLLLADVRADQEGGETT